MCFGGVDWWISKTKMMLSSRFQRFWFTLSLCWRGILEKMVVSRAMTSVRCYVCCFHCHGLPLLLWVHILPAFSLFLVLERIVAGMQSMKSEKWKSFRSLDVIMVHTRKHKNVKCEWNESFFFLHISRDRIVSYCDMETEEKDNSNNISRISRAQCHCCFFRGVWKSTYNAILFRIHNF